MEQSTIFVAPQLSISIISGGGTFLHVSFKSNSILLGIFNTQFASTTRIIKDRRVEEVEEVEEVEYASVRDWGWAHHLRTRPEREARERRKAELEREMA